MDNSQIKQIILNYRYNKLSNIILQLEMHIENLYTNNKLIYVNKNNYLKNLFGISKELNINYNNYILNELNNDICSFNNLIKICSLFLLDTDIINYIKPLFIMYNDKLPLYSLEKDLLNIIYDIGLNSIKNIMDIHDIILTQSQYELINEINNIFIPTKVRIFNVANRNYDYYWTIPNEYNEMDMLELTRELWIKNKNKNNEYIKIEGYFINDTLSINIKTSQLTNNILYNKKNSIVKALNTTNKFKKKFIRYDYLGNIYCMNTEDYVHYINKMHNLFIELIDTTFVNIMKNFIGDKFKIKIVYDIIFLLLLGTDDNVSMVNLLLDLTKEKKANCPNINNIILQNIPYYLQARIKKNSNILKTEIDRMKALNVDDVNYRNILASNKNIPNNIKAITLEKINEMKTFNNEYHKQLTFVKHIINFPWAHNEDNKIIDNPIVYLDNIKNKLTTLSFGHEEAKKTLLQMIGKWITNPSSGGTCFGLVGPPGVGKTLLAKSVSDALNIPFGEITLGGQNDGEILHGHGYTYAGSQPGMIIKKMVEMGKSRCILYFDELDKACSKHGSVNEITSILIHLTDPNMNKTFQDRFFQGVDFPLDKVIMIFSYNDSKLVDPILLDRLKQIHVEAYTITDKINIVKHFIIPELALSIGLHNEPWIHIDDDIIEFIIDSYTNEAGVRSIKRLIDKIFLTLNLEKIYKTNDFANDFKITKDIINKILDKTINDITYIHKEPYIGILNGLYATNNGDGGIIPIQIFNNTSLNNTFEMKYTGKQGDIMKESIQCSLTACIEYLKRKNIKINMDEFKQGFHIHTPSTSIPKDGPSAGCAFTTAFISRILNRPIKNYIAMTGEIELTGRITKIGGLNYKLFGAKKAGVKLVYVPYENEKDINEIKIKSPKLIDSNFEIKFFNYIDEIIDEILL
jgi:endopeptidase La